MIRNIIISGCSFTCFGWPDAVRAEFYLDNFINLARIGAGNQYISDSLINCLATEKYLPEETLVLVMWSGVTRKDLMVSDEFYQMVDYPFKESIYGQNYIFSGGEMGSWQSADLIKPLFKPWYQATDKKTMGHESLMCISHTKGWLEAHEFNYKFMSYVDYWGSDDKTVSPNLDFNLGNHAAGDPLLTDLGTQWIWAQDDAKCLYELAGKHDELSPDRFHPSPKISEYLAREFIIPRLYQDHQLMKKGTISGALAT